MHKFYTVLMYVTAAIVIILSTPFFILYGVSHLLTGLNKTVIDFLEDNPVSQFFIRKVIETSPKQEEDEEP